MSKIEVSVIVPVYNVEEYLDRCLKSLINQEFDNYEVIVVNDGSPDNSQTIIDEYVKNYPDKIISFEKENGGVSSARNYGLKKAKGKYVAFVDSDDYVSKNYLKILYDKAINNDSDIVICDMYKTFPNRKEIMRGKDNAISDNKKDQILSIPACWNKLYKKSLFIDNDIYFPEISYGEDLATTIRLIISSKKITYVDKPLYYYIQRDNSLMNQKKYNPKTKDIIKSLDILKNYFIDNNYYDEYNEELEYIYISHLMHDYVLRVYMFKESKEAIQEVITIIKDNYKKWNENKYFKRQSLKYKIVCYLIYFQMTSILKIILK